jgi:hypothetical protein
MRSGIIGRIGSMNHAPSKHFTFGPGLIYESHFEPSMVWHARNSTQKYQDRESLEKLTPQLAPMPCHDKWPSGEDRHEA